MIARSVAELISLISIGEISAHCCECLPLIYIMILSKVSGVKSSACFFVDISKQFLLTPLNATKKRLLADNAALERVKAISTFSTISLLPANAGDFVPATGA